MSDSESDSDSSVFNSPTSYSGSRPRRKTTPSNYSEKDNGDSDSSNSDGQAQLKRRLDEFLGEDSGSDKDFVPTPRKKRMFKYEKRYISSKESFPEEPSDIRNTHVKKQRTEKRATKIYKKKVKKKKAYKVFKNLNTEKRKGSRLTTVQEAEEAVTNNQESEDEINEKSEGGDSSALLSNILQRPCLLKRLEGPRCISVFTGKHIARNSKNFVNIPAPWLRYLNHLISDMKEVTTHQGMHQSLAFIKSILSTRNSGILAMGASNISTWTLNINLGYLIVDSIAANIDNIELRINQLCWLGKFFLDNNWRRFRFTFIRIIKHLLNLGALQDALRLLEDPGMVIPDNLDTELHDFLSMVHSVNNMINTSDNNVNETMQNEEQVNSLDNISAGTKLLIEKTGHKYTNLLPLLSWYISDRHDIDLAADTLKILRDNNLSDERTHRVLITFLKSQEFESEQILEALKSASEEFPYKDFAVDYCQGLLQKDEDLDEDFDEDEIDSLQQKSLELEDIVEKLVKYFDFSLNMMDEVAWSILVNTSIQLIRSDWGKQVIIRHINPRSDWWFDQCLETNEDCSSFCLGHKLLFTKICFGENSYYEQILCTLTDKLGSDKSTLNTFLSQVSVTSEDPLINTLQDLKIQDENDVISDQINYVKNNRRSVKDQSSNVWYKNSEFDTSNEEYIPQNEKPMLEKTILVESESQIDLQKNPTYFKNFLYMKRKTKFVLLEKYVDCICDPQANQKVRIRLKVKKEKLELYLYPSRYRDKILKCLKRNIEEEKFIEKIIMEEFNLSYESRFVCSYLRKTVLPRIESCIDWSPINSLKLPEDNNLSDKFKKLFLLRCDFIMREKLSPWLGLNIAKKECRRDIYSKSKTIVEMNDELDELDKLATFINQSI